MSTGYFNSFLLLAILRFAHGTISSAINPLCYSLLADTFPADKRSTPNSLLSAANFIGIALSSMTIILIKNLGWRMSYMTMGVTGLLASTLGYFFLKNPKRGQYDIPLSEEEKEKKRAKEAAKPKGFQGFLNQMSEFNKNPVCSNIFAAGFIRSMASVIVTAFLPVFFQKTFPAFKS